MQRSKKHLCSITSSASASSVSVRPTLSHRVTARLAETHVAPIESMSIQVDYSPSRRDLSSRFEVAPDYGEETFIGLACPT
jgi:hypothetical protein